MNSLFLANSILIFAISIFLGCFLLLGSSRAIEIQRRLYEKMNWRIEPISMQKEIRNTRFMGLFLLILILLSIIYLVVKVF